ncbi:cysteine sulfinic acid decarboxylase-like isoform X2 [Photinus pyralis]|uniref:cysteine sulfinic acid decarboxylase-like isoform X2 n=1 Tax=Photinus pyralis TaxID=7054 RepID=UPI0012673A59|nr:cysteine sulfinic acid decarboxylase-like isoform X2 [Photinus pyralis]
MEEDFSPTPDYDKHGWFLKSVVEILFKSVVFATNRDKVVLWKHPEELLKVFDFSLRQTGVAQDKLLTLIKNTIKYSVKTGHPYFVNQLFSGLDPYGLVGQWITDALNASLYTYEVAPVFTLMESGVIREMCGMIGPDWKDGMFCPGGSNGNGIALNLARFRLNKNVKRTGMSQSPRLVLFTSEEAHYSIQKFASFIGIGEDNVILVQTDKVGRMKPASLEECIRNQIDFGATPFAVVATLGTTVRGAFDPLYQISTVCNKYGLWLHVDAAWGGGLIFSQKHRAKLNGIETANSIIINPHKLLAAPQQCSILFVKDENILHECHSKGAEYLFQKDKYYDQWYDPGDKYLQCGRKCDVFKFWLMWKAKGSSGFAKHVDSIMDVAEYFERQVLIRPEFQLVSKRQYINVCFWYLPRYLQKKKDVMDYSMQLHKVAAQIKAVMVKHGSIMLGYQPLKEFPNFFRFVSQNSSLSTRDVDFILDHIAEIEICSNGRMFNLKNLD